MARVAGRLGADVTAIVVAGGAVGRQLTDLITAEGISVVPIEQSRETRECFAVAERSTGQQYRFVTPGPPLDTGAVEAVGEAALELIGVPAEASSQPVVVLSGSMPTATAPGVIDQLVRRLTPVDVIVDTSGPGLVEALGSPAALVKPSARELQDVVGRALASEADVLRAAAEVLAESSVGALLVSIGSGGAFLLSRDQPPLRLRAPTVQVRSAVGAGDSMVAGVAVARANGLSFSDAAQLGIAAGTATVMTPGTGLCSAADAALLEPMVVSEHC